MTTTALHWLDAAALAHAYRALRLTPAATVDHLLARIDRLDPELNAFVALRKAEARAEAAASSRRHAAGAPLGPLDGIPVAVKDVIDVAGLPTTCHSKTRLNAIAVTDAVSIARLRAGGAIVLGKLATHEFAIGGPAFDLPFPPARNPWNTHHHPGGSSSGAGAAVAAGLVPLAIGTDTAGSARHPASACGIVGFKPGFGRISCAGVVPLARSLDHVGILARSAVDCATAYELIAEPGEPRNEAGSGVAGLRIGYVRHFHESDMPADPEVSAALNDAAARLIDAGAEVETVRLPSLDQFAITNRLILQSEGWAAHGAGIAARPGDYSALTRRALLPGAFLTAADMDAAVRLRRRLTAALDVALGRVDVLLCASSMTLPCRLDDAGGIAATYMRQARTPFNLGGHPAITLPAGVAVSGLPLSIQLAAGHGREAMLLRAAAGWESIGRGFVPPPVDFPISPSAP